MGMKYGQVCAAILLSFFIVGCGSGVETSGDQSIYANASFGELGKVRGGIEAGFDVNSQDEYGCTVLHYAVDGTHTNLAEMLIVTYGADASIKDNEGNTPVDVALRVGDPAMLSVFENEGLIQY